MSLFTQLQIALQLKHEQGLYRERLSLRRAGPARLRQGDFSLIDFASNDYLGLSQSPQLKLAATEALSEYGVGSGASHLICGHMAIHEELETVLAQWLGQEKALLFSTGYMANLALVRALGQNNALIFQDKLNHASLIDAGQFKECDSRRYLHCDMASLKGKLERLDGRPALIVTDGVFSMDGDLAPLPAILQLAEKFNAAVIIDDAHGIGVIGKQGRGSYDYFSANQHEGLSGHKDFAIMGTLGKALGCFGAFVTGPKVLIDYLVQFARPYIYTTALPPAVAAAAIKAIELIRNPHYSPLPKLRDNIDHFRQVATDFNLPLEKSITAIQPLIVGDNARCLAIGRALRKEGFLIGTIRPPTVPNGTARLRISLSANHDAREIEQLCQQLKTAISQHA